VKKSILAVMTASGVACPSPRHWRSVSTARPIASMVLIALSPLWLSGCMAPRTAGVKVDPAAAAREEQIQRDMRIERQYAQKMRALNVSYPVLKGATSLCKDDVRQSIGLLQATLADFSKDNVGAAKRYGVRDEPTVIGTVDASPAATAGLLRGDVLKTYNAVPIEATGSKATANSMEKLMKALSANPTVRVGFERQGVLQEVTVQAETVCSYPVVMVQDDVVNAYADGDAIYITTGMMRFAETDQELATVVGHELAHNAMGHIKAKTVNRAIGTIFDVLAAAYGANTNGAFGNATGQAFSQEFEAEADYVGVYALALGGVDTQGVANLWRRMGANTGSIETKYGSSHPGSTDRYVAIEAAVAEVNEKVNNMQPLEPNLKSKGQPATR
jgi:hypothetical protein